MLTLSQGLANLDSIDREIYGLSNTGKEVCLCVAPRVRAQRHNVGEGGEFKKKIVFMNGSLTYLLVNLLCQKHVVSKLKNVNKPHFRSC